MSNRLSNLRSGVIKPAPAMVMVMALVVVCAVPMNSAHSQIIGGDLSSLSQRFSYTSWGLSGDTTDLTVSQWYLLIVVKSDIAPDWKLALSTAAAGSDVDWDLTDGKISGLTDTRIQASHSI